MTTLSQWLDPTLIESLNHLALHGHRVAQGLTPGAHRSAAKGASLEFRQHRAYVPGDEPRRIDWRVLARADRVFVKEYDAETNLRVQIVLDASGSMTYGRPRTKFDYACRLTAAMAYLMLAQTERVGLAMASADASAFVPPASAATQLVRIIETISAAKPNGATSLDATISRLADRAGRRSLVIIVSDCMTSAARLQSALARLAFGRHEIVLLRVLHPDEILFPFNRWTTFHGLEQESTLSLDLAASRDQYTKNFKAHERSLTAACLQLKVNLLTLTTDRPLIEAIRAIAHRGSL